MNLKKIGKRLMSLLLTLCMVISVIPVSAALAASDDVSLGGSYSPRARTPQTYTYQEIFDGFGSLILYPGDKVEYSEVEEVREPHKIKINYRDHNYDFIKDGEVFTVPDTGSVDMNIEASLRSESTKVKYSAWKVQMFTKNGDYMLLTVEGVANESPINVSSKDEATGTISSNSSEAMAGTTVWLKIDPKLGYAFSFEDSTIEPALEFINDYYTAFIMPNEPVKIQAAFKKIEAHKINIIGGEARDENWKPVGEATEGSYIFIEPNGDRSKFVRWESDIDLEYGDTEPSNQFTMPDREVHLKAIYQGGDTEHAINVTAEGSGTATANLEKAVKGSEITLNAAANPGHHFKEWKVESGNVSFDLKAASVKFTMPDEAVSVKAIFEANQSDEYSITVNDGTASVNDQKVGKAKKGTTVELTAWQKEGKVFKNWTVKDNAVQLDDPNSESTAFTMPGQAVEITANYDDIIVSKHKVTVQNDGAARGNAKPSESLPGTPVSLYVYSVDPGYVFKEWQVVSGGVTIANNTFLMPENDVIVRPVAEQKPAVSFKELTPRTPMNIGATIQNDETGAQLASVRYLKADGSLIKEEVNKPFPYAVTNQSEIFEWEVESTEGTGADCKLVLIEKQRITSELTINGGTATVNGAAATKAKAGDLVTIEADKAPDGKVFDKWQVSDGVNLKDITAATTDFIMPAKAVSITALYKDAPVAEYTVTIKNDGNGTAKSDVNKAKAGDTVRLTATPKAGYVFKEWQIVKGKVVIKNNSFTMPAENVEIKAVFAKKSAPAPKPVDPTKPVNNGGAKNPVTGLDMSTTETSGFALVALSMLLLGTTAVFRRRKAR